MTDLGLTIEIAKIDGACIHENEFVLYPQGYGNGFNRCKLCKADSEGLHYKPYLNSRDEIIRVIEKYFPVGSSRYDEFSECLRCILCTPLNRHPDLLTPLDFIRATARQLCIALLKALGKPTE